MGQKIAVLLNFWNVNTRGKALGSLKRKVNPIAKRNVFRNVNQDYERSCVQSRHLGFSMVRKTTTVNVIVVKRCWRKAHHWFFRHMVMKWWAEDSLLLGWWCWTEDHRGTSCPETRSNLISRGPPHVSTLLCHPNYYFTTHLLFKSNHLNLVWRLQYQRLAI